MSWDRSGAEESDVGVPQLPSPRENPILKYRELRTRDMDVSLAPVNAAPNSLGGTQQEFRRPFADHRPATGDKDGC